MDNKAGHRRFQVQESHLSSGSNQRTRTGHARFRRAPVGLTPSFAAADSS
ncbi:putative WRKY transcription factor 15-like protein [Corchorus olitorius]|uniref:WRKY transcription factor 15-like protein n=1 Tax=Corchorus olitorius TaxID=93759 RepID=A0A1R3GAU0_9ROSI|nr:putative WRKY transcription factor 15-like protein [Corchorus olitorius]